MIILCHKCSGVLTNSDDVDVTGLADCRCISGYVRGFDPVINTALEAAKVQIKNMEKELTWFLANGRDENSASVRDRRRKLAVLAAKY